MIELGSIDADVSDSAYKAYTSTVEQLTRRPLADIAAGVDKIVVKRLPANTPAIMSVAQVQQALKNLGFFPNTSIDGICGYRTQSAIRLFQEYVRSVEKLASTPDGQFGPKSQAHLQRWLDNKLQTVWAPIIEAWKNGATGPGEYADWIALLESVKQQALASPTRVQKTSSAFVEMRCRGSSTTSSFCSSKASSSNFRAPLNRVRQTTLQVRRFSYRVSTSTTLDGIKANTSHSVPGALVCSSCAPAATNILMMPISQKASSRMGR